MFVRWVCLTVVSRKHNESVVPEVAAAALCLKGPSHISDRLIEGSYHATVDGTSWIHGGVAVQNNYTQKVFLLR